MYGELKRLYTDPSKASAHPLRTEEMVGRFENQPIVGRSFRIIGKPIKKGSASRVIATSIVEEISPIPNGWIFQTMNSRYQLTLMEEE